MVQGRVVRPLMMGGHPSSSSKEQLQENHQPHRKSSKRRPSDRRRSQDDMHILHMGKGSDLSRYSSRRYDRPKKKKSSTMSRMKSIFSFGSSMDKFRQTDDNKFYPSSDTNVDYMESQGRHGNNNSRLRKRDHRLSPQEIRRPFVVPSFATLSQRADLWIITAVSSCVSLASLAQLLSASKDTLSSPNRKFAFSTSVISFIIAFALGAAFRYAPFRHSVTRSRSIISPPSRRLDFYGSPIIAGIRTAISQSYISIELLLVSILSLFWTIAIPIIVDGINHIGGQGQDPLAVFGMEIWNANLFYSSWISAILIGYIYIELLTSTDRYGTMPSSSSTSSGASSWKENTFSKRWVLLTLSSIVVLSSSVTVYGSNLCDGDILKGTVYCRKALLGILVGGFVQLVCCCCVGVLYRIRNMGYTSSSSSSYYYDSRGRRRKVNKRQMMKKMSVWKREKYSLYFGIISLIVQSINVALLTDPIGGGPGNSSGSLYFASWVSFFLVFEMCLRYLELHTTSTGRKVKRKSDKASAPDDTDHSDVTFASEEEEELPPEEQSTVMRILRNGSMGSRSSSGAPVYEEVDSFSAESPRYAIMPQASYRVQPPPPAPSPPENNTTREALRPQIEPEEETKTSPNSSSRDFLNESVKDFSIGSRKSSPDPSGDRPRALPPYSVGSASDDISNDELFQQVSQAQSYVTQESNVSEELDEPRIFIPQHYDVMQGSRHNLNNSSNLSPLNEDSKEGRRSSDSQLRSRSGSERSASRSGSERSGSRQSGSRQSGSRQSGSYHSGSRQSGSYQNGSRQSGSKYSSEESQELEQIPPPPVYRPTKAVRQKSQSSLRSKSKSKSRSRSGSRGKSRNGSRESRRSRSRGNPDVYTDSDHDSAEGSPPPTISDSGKSHRSNLSGFSQGSPATQSRSKSTKSGKKNGPPPPPFQREVDEPPPQYFADKQNRRPVTSVFTKSGSFGDESVVSDPTLDACFHNVPAPVPTRNTASAQIPRNRSDPSFDKDKSVTSSPPEGSRSSGQYRRSSSDELPPSEENVPNGSEGSGNEQVDNIVAAALAYAEKTHSLSSVPQGSSPAPQSHKAKKRQSGSSRRRRRKSDPEIRASQTSGASSGFGSAVGSAAVSGASLHSFYSGDKPNEKTSQEDLGDSIRSNPTIPSVADMVSAALAYAEESRGRGRGAAQKPAEKSEKSQSSSKHSSKHTKSVGSMFSDSDYDSGADEKSEFDC